MASQHAHTESVLDAAVLDDLASLDASLVADVVQSFLSDVPARIAALRTVADDAHAVARAAHALKGSALAVGATGLRDACVALERAAESGDVDGMQRHAAELDPAFDRVNAALQAWL